MAQTKGAPYFARHAGSRKACSLLKVPEDECASQQEFSEYFSWMEIDARQSQADQHPSNLQKQVLSQVRADMGASQNAGTLKGPRSPRGLGFSLMTAILMGALFVGTCHSNAELNGPVTRPRRRLHGHSGGFG